MNLTCPQCGNTSPPQPVGTVWCDRYEEHYRKLRRWVAVEMEESE